MNLSECVPISILITICSLGLLYQVEEVSDRYFRFETGTVVTLLVPDEIRYPWMSVCFEYHDLINRSLFRTKYNVTLKYFREADFDGFEFSEQTKMLSISQMFQLTPSIEDVLSNMAACEIHFPGKFTVDHMNKTSCHGHFKVYKYLIRHTVCYLFKPQIHDLIRMHEFKLSPGYSGLLYKLFIDPNVVNNIQRMYAAVHYNFSSFLLDSIFSGYVESDDPTIPNVYVIYREFSRIRLEAPYDTNCSWPSGNYATWGEDSMHKIDAETIKKYNYSRSVRSDIRSEP